MNEVEIFWPRSCSSEILTGAVKDFEVAGFETTCRLQPTRRNVELAALIVFGTTTIVKPFLGAAFEQIADDAYAALRRFVANIFGRPSSKTDRDPAAPNAVLFESTQSRAQFVFTDDLPDEAYRSALELDPGEAPGRWVWSTRARAWCKFEDRVLTTT